MDTQAIRKLQATLGQIKQGNTVFFNVVQFEAMGLVKARKVFTGRLASNGEKMTRTKYALTAKASRILEVII